MNIARNDGETFSIFFDYVFERARRNFEPSPLLKNEISFPSTNYSTVRWRRTTFTNNWESSWRESRLLPEDLSVGFDWILGLDSRVLANELVWLCSVIKRDISFFFFYVEKRNESWIFSSITVYGCNKQFARILLWIIGANIIRSMFGDSKGFVDGELSTSFVYEIEFRRNFIAITI